MHYSDILLFYFVCYIYSVTSLAYTGRPKMSSVEKKLAAYDNALLGILQNEGKLETFLDVIFGFLCRRTDFFMIMQNEKQRYGFPPGVAEKMISSVSYPASTV